LICGTADGAMEDLFNFFLNLLIAGLVARYCYIHDVSGRFASSLLSLIGDDEKVLLETFQGSTASLVVRPGGSDIGQCGGTDYAFTGLLNGRPMWKSSARRRIIAFNSRSWVCTDVKYLKDITEGSLKGKVFGGYVITAVQDTAFEKSTWKDYVPRLELVERQVQEEPSLGETNKQYKAKIKEIQDVDVTNYTSSRVVLQLRAGEHDSGCAAADYLFAGKLNGRPYWVSKQKARFLGFNGEQWICSGVEFLQDIQTGSLKNKTFGGYESSAKGPASLEKSTWKRFTVKMLNGQPKIAKGAARKPET